MITTTANESYVVVKSLHWPGRASYYAVDCEDDDTITPDELLNHPLFEDMLLWFHSDSDLKAQMKRGDILHFMPAGGYRNDGKLIFDGEHLVMLYNPGEDSDPDEYGYIPNTFLAINEFPPNYWDATLDMNVSRNLLIL